MFRKLIFILFVFVLSLIFIGGSFAQVDDVRSSPNYLVILVHGIISNKEAFDGADGLKKFLEDNLGLNGYVYDFAYDFSDDTGSIIEQGKELGDISHKNPSWAGEMPSLTNEAFWKNEEDWSKIYNNHSWISQSKDYFRAWFKWKNPDNSTHRDPTEAEVPRKVVFICHSMGGLTVRSYITSDYYKNDVLRIITLDTPHTGSDLVAYLKKYYSFENLAKTGFTNNADAFLKEFSANIKNSLFGDMDKKISDKLVKISGLFKIPTIDDVYRDSMNWVIAGESWRILKLIDAKQWTLKMDYDLTITPWLWSSVLELIRYCYFAGEGLNQMDPNSSFIKNLRSADIKAGSDPISFRLVSARGAFTPHKDYINRYYLTTPYIAQQLIPWSPEYQAISNKSQKYWSLLASMLFPGIYAIKDGSVVVSVDSSRGEGVSLFQKYDTQRYDIFFKNNTFENVMNIIDGTYDACLAAYVLSCVFSPAPPPVDMFFLLPKVELTFYSLVFLPNDFLFEKGTNSVLKAHILIPTVVKNREGGEPSIIEKCLDDIPMFGGHLQTLEATSGISAASVSTSTASFNAYDQKFALLSNKDSSGKETDQYHTVTIEAISKDGGPLAFPVEINGKQEIVSAVTVKEAPTAIKGVINTFFPKKLKQFQYSENFAAWKDVGEVDKWGNFTLKGLKLAEGQNVIAFRAETWTGNTSNQHVKIIVNTIPCVPSKFVPISGTYTNNPKPEISVEFHKSKYAAEGAGFKILACTLNGAPITPELLTSTDDYGEVLKVKFIPPAPLADGEYNIAIKVESDVGVSQALWSFTVDTIPPAITIEPMKPVSFKKIEEK